MLTGIIVMMGWFLDIAILKSLLPQWVTMKFTTALCFLISGLILFLMAKSSEGQKEFTALFVPILSLIIMLFMSTLLLGFFLKLNLGVEQLFVPESADAIKTTLPGRPSAGTMILFIVIAMLGFVHTLASKKVAHVTRISGGLIGLAGLVAIGGYALDSPILYYMIEGVSTAMALHTAILFVFLGVGFVLLAYPDQN